MNLTICRSEGARDKVLLICLERLCAMGRMNRSRNADLPMRRHTANHPPSPPNSLAEKTFRRRQTLCHITGVAAHSRTVRRRVVIGNSNTLLGGRAGPQV